VLAAMNDGAVEDGQADRQVRRDGDRDRGTGGLQVPQHGDECAGERHGEAGPQESPQDAAPGRARVTPLMTR